MGTGSRVRVSTARGLGLLSVVCLSPVLAQKLKTRDAGEASREYSFAVPASQRWFDTGLELQPGELIHVYGGVAACTGASGDRHILTMPSAPEGALLAKLHAEARPVVATPDAELSAINASHLYLGVNGVNCSGKLPAKVVVENTRSRRSSQ
jgi:hypothetical protein